MRALVLGGGGFIGGHLINRLSQNGYWVRSADIKAHEYGTSADDFLQGDLTSAEFCSKVLKLSGREQFNRVYQLAADMGGAGYIFTGENDANVMSNSSLINLNLLRSAVETEKNGRKDFTRYFYSSSACIYPEEKQLEIDNPGLRESDAYPANPDSEYGWEKLFSERLYSAFARNYNLQVRIARFHNVFGPKGAWKGGREKAPAAICRKVAVADDYGSIEIWGDGNQTRSFLYIEECLDAVERLMQSDFDQPINIGSERILSIRDLIDIVSAFEGKKLKVVSLPGPLGVRGRKSNNELLRSVLGWEFQDNLESGLKATYDWIKSQLKG